MKKLQVSVIGDAIVPKEQAVFCERLGLMLADLNVIVITGGRGGVMESVCKGAHENGGMTVGILPSSDKSEANPWCTVVIPTGMGHSRNSLTAASADVVISVGGQAGTLTEIGFSWIYGKPIISVMNFGGWSEKMAGKSPDHRQKGTITGVSSLDALKKEILRIAGELGYNLLRQG